MDPQSLSFLCTVMHTPPSASPEWSQGQAFMSEGQGALWDKGSSPGPARPLEKGVARVGVVHASLQ